MLQILVLQTSEKRAGDYCIYFISTAWWWWNAQVT